MALVQPPRKALGVSVPIVTVAIPVHDTVEYVAECLESVLAQTLRELEVVCVDDGSTDGSLEVLERYAARDGRVSVIRRHVQDRGPGAARNLVIERATGRYIAFIDSDDVIRPTMLESLVAAAEATGADVTMCMLRPFDADGEHHTACTYDQVIPNHLDDRAFSWRDLGEDVFRLRFASCNKVYRREFLRQRDIRYGEDGYYEDMIFTFRALLEASALGFVRAPLYLNRKERAEATTFVQGDRAMDALEPLSALQRLLEGEPAYRSLVPAFWAFRYRKLCTYLVQNDIDHIAGFYDELRRVASHVDLRDSSLLTEEEDEVRRRIVDNDVWEFLVWYVWYLDAGHLRTARRLAKARAQRVEFRDEVRELRAENRRLTSQLASRHVRSRIRRMVGPRGTALLRRFRDG